VTTVAIGIDPGLAWCGLAAVDADSGELLWAGVHATKRDRTRRGDASARLLDLQRWLRGRLAELSLAHQIVAVGVEWPLVAGRAAGASRANSATGGHQVALAAGAAHSLLSAQWDHVATPIPSQWRAWYCGGQRNGSGRAPALIEERYGVASRVGRTRAPHACDAIGVALYAAAHGAT
jgi:Holliday junction resolvasome RuvABC endonuclease subunit